MSDQADRGAPRPDAALAPRSVLLGRDLAPDPRALAAVSLADFEAIARVRMHPGAFDYVAGGAWDEVSLDENVAGWRRRRFRPWALAAGGQPAVEHALAVLREEFEIALALLGATTPAGVTRAHLAG